MQGVSKMTVREAVRGIGAVALGLALTAIAAAPASATFPGRNGDVVFAWTGKHGAIYRDSAVLAKRPGSKTRELRRCNHFYLSTEPGACVTDTPSISPDGRELAYAVQQLYPESNSVERTWLEIVPTAGGTRAEVPLAQSSFDAVWSPDASQLLVTRHAAPGDPLGSGATRIFLVGRDGRELGVVTPDGGRSPDWAANGAIAFENAGRIWIIWPGEKPRQLTSKKGSSPSWSPDGRRIAFESAGNVWTVGVHGKGLQRLTRRGGLDPAWSPDGRRIAFVRHLDRDPTWFSLYTARVDRRGAGVQPLWDFDKQQMSAGVAREPVWQPLPR
jgi:Tol biopolymer transport system component